VPAALDLQIWPAAHRDNPRGVDLVVAPAAECVQALGDAACATAASIRGADGVMRFVVATAAAWHMEAATTLACAATA
jgi:hypothetical protein